MFSYTRLFSRQEKMTLKNNSFRQRRKQIQIQRQRHNKEKQIKVKLFLSSDRKTIIGCTKSGLKGSLTGAAKRKAEHVINTYGIDDFWSNSYGLIKIKESEFVYA
jgi:hypothetical protein